VPTLTCTGWIITCDLRAPRRPFTPGAGPGQYHPSRFPTAHIPSGPEHKSSRGGGEGEAPIREEQARLFLGEVERVVLEALFGQRRRGRAEPVLVPAAVVVADLPRDLRLAADLPLDAGGRLRETRALLPVDRARGVDVVSGLPLVPRPRRTTREAASYRQQMVSLKCPNACPWIAYAGGTTSDLPSATGAEPGADHGLCW
jgi:hypothetical protein